MKVFAIAAIFASVQAIKLEKQEYPTKDPDTLRGEVQPLQWCPDYDERHVLLDGKTAAVAWPEKGFNCKTFHTVLEGNKNPYSQGWYHNE